MDYYRLSNEVRFKTQRLQEYFNEVFEISLNSSLLSEKIKIGHDKGQVLEVTSQKLGSISSELKDNVSKLLSEAALLSKHSLIFNKTSSQREKLIAALPIVKQEDNKKAVQEAIKRFENQMKNSCEQSIDQVRTLNGVMKTIGTLSKKVWVSINNMKIEINQEDNNSNFTVIADELEVITEEVKNILLRLEQILKNIEQFSKDFIKQYS